MLVKKLRFIICIGMLVLILVGCKNKETSSLSFDVDGINISILSRTEFLNNKDKGIGYTFELINNSDETIKHLNMLVGFAMSEQATNEGVTNPIMFNATSDEYPINIQSGEKRVFRVYIPTELMKEEYININDIRIHIIGYINEIGHNNRFEKSGSVSFFNGNFEKDFKSEESGENK